MSIWAGAGAVAGGLINYASGQQNNSNMTRNAWEQRSWENYMSSSAHQREVKDLKAAGLNPILSAGGNGASTPSPATPNLQPPQIDITPVFEVVRLGQEQQKINMQEELLGPKKEGIKASTEGTKASTRLKHKGTVRADLEKEGAGLLQDMLKSFKKGIKNETSQDALKRHNERTNQNMSVPTVDPLR